MHLCILLDLLWEKFLVTFVDDLGSSFDELSFSPVMLQGFIFFTIDTEIYC